MSTIRLGSHGLLEYNSRYRVLICRECQYAIQKGALGSHLLRHKIYRDKKEALLASIAQLDLLEPHLVPPPDPSAPPIDALAIIPGYRCSAASCGNLCASTKRMRRHWSEIHGISDPLPDISAFASPVTLQTFFRGTKLRYFEVTSPEIYIAHGNEIPRNGESEEEESRRNGQRLHARSPGTSSLPPSTGLADCVHSPSGGSALDPSLVDFDLQTLTYLHHFNISTSLTLFDIEHPRSATQYWQTDFILPALRSRWLMCGLMAISACHMAALADDRMTTTIHYDRSVQFFSKFSELLAQTTVRDLHMFDVEAEEEAKRAGKQLTSLLRCAYWSLAESTLDERTTIESLAPFELLSFIKTIRGIFHVDFTLPPNATQVDNGDEGDIFAQAKQILEAKVSTDLGTSDNPSSGNNTSATSRTVLGLLGALPSRMAEAFPKPQNGADFLATMSAIAALIKCCNMSFASEDRAAAWWGMVAWLIKIPGHFNAMLECYIPPAMVVLAHWAALLVRRAECCGIWFLKGLGNRLLLQVVKRIPARETAVHDILGGLRERVVKEQTR